ncbi:BAR adaptor protein Hob1, partial [Dimargaris xerosporica]
MSWRGLKKAINRLPHQVMSKVGQADTTVDEDYDLLARQFKDLFTNAEKLNLDAQSFRDSIGEILNHEYGMFRLLAELYQPLIGELTDATMEASSQNATLEQQRALEAVIERAGGVREKVMAELDLINSNVVYPVNEFTRSLGEITKVMEKRDRKMIDYDRVRHNLKKLREKQDRKVDEERKIHQLDNDFEQSSREFNHYNDSLKADLPQVLELRTRLIEPCVAHLYKLQVSIYGMMIQHLRELLQASPFNPNTTALEAYQVHQTKVKELLGSISVAGHYHTEAQLTEPPPTHQSPLHKASGLFAKNGGKSATTSTAASPIPPNSDGSQIMPSKANAAMSPSIPLPYGHTGAEAGGVAHEEAPPPAYSNEYPSGSPPVDTKAAPIAMPAAPSDSTPPPPQYDEAIGRPPPAATTTPP